ncbi:MAG: hypothetical protein IJZ16_11985 [Clostridia bacterium]|nr:hypothetical protein [Clostridia bacterium]
MKKSCLQKLSNIIFHFLLIFSCYIALCSEFAPWDDYATLLNTLSYALIFLSGFFHHISYKYNSLWILSTIILVLRGIIAITFSIINEGMLIVEIIVFAILLILHLVSYGKFDGEIKIHEFDVKTEDGRYVKVTFKEKIKNNSSSLDVKTVLKEFLISILILFLVLVFLLIAWIVLCAVDSEMDFWEEVNSLPDELVSQEYLDEFHLYDYEREYLSGRYLLGISFWEEDCYYNNDAEYIIVSEPTRIISDSNKVNKNTYWQIGDNKNFIMNLVDEDWGNYERAYYINKNCVFPNETNKIVKVIAEYDKEIKFSEEQINYIEKLVKDFDDDVINKDKKEFLNDNEYLNDYALVFCFEGFDDIRLACCSIVKDINGQWYLYKDFHYGREETINFYDLEKLPQDICDTINKSLK